MLPGAWLLGALVGASAPALSESAIVSALWVLGLGALLALDSKLSPRSRARSRHVWVSTTGS